MRLLLLTQLWRGSRYSLSHALSHSTTSILSLLITLLKFALVAYILTHLFWLFTYVALMGRTLRLFTNIVSRVGYLHNSGFGLGRVPHQLGSSTDGFPDDRIFLTIRSDMFPNIIITITIIVITIEFSNSRITVFDPSIVGFPNSRLFLPLEGHIPYIIFKSSFRSSN